jgi:hypothetical protein
MLCIITVISLFLRIYIETINFAIHTIVFRVP